MTDTWISLHSAAQGLRIEAALLTFWRALNAALRERGYATGVPLGLARRLYHAGFTPAEATSVLAPTICLAAGGADAGLPPGRQGRRGQ